ncbi:MAG: biotin--[acetyl-CoA-carboxylase] ligase [Armatimonadota bacterium]|nr:biotin--[acetyl-CoA-carboxylase] ligase [Armatimonadota bacterium]MCX7776645.1 biotin--[acetyl-CoA-carboxylase] ligase [Armatimonadota bacterium]MDW8025211.1 biotin--[acetyl-CoA-carboxylase] ligase [Armatimonadota bacterium]
MQKLLNTKWLGRSMVYMQSANSTNDVGKRLAEYNAPNGVLIVAETQTSGRGRFGRSWVSPEGGIYMSLILRTVTYPEDLLKLMVATAVGTCEGLRRVTSLPVMVKWVNDLILDGKKVGGILIESKSSGKEVEFAVVGIGVNANVDVNSFPSELRCRAISLHEVTGKELSREHIVASILDGLECRYEQLMSGEFEDVRQSFNRLHIAHGKLVEVNTGSHTFVGKVEGLGENGELTLRLENGNTVSVTDGTINLLR